MPAERDPSAESHPAEAPRSELALAGLAASLQALYLHLPFFLDPRLFHNNWRQSPHWIAAARNRYVPDDPLVEYAAFNTGPFENLLYKALGLLGPDILWGKVNAIVLYAVTAAIVYAVGYAYRERVGGIAAAAIFCCFPSTFPLFVGGYSSGMSMPLLALALLFVFRERWWAFVPLVGAAVVVYPMVSIQIGAFLIADTLAHDLKRLRDPELWRRKLLPLSIAAAACALMLLGKYAAEHDYGHLVDRTEMLGREEFGRDGRAKLLPVPPFGFQLRKFLGDPFHLVLASVALVALGRRTWTLPRGLWSMVVTSAVLYWLADLLLLQLYYPNRYTLRSFPLVLALAGAFWIGGAFERLTRPAWRGAVAVVALVGIATFPGSFVPPGGEGAGGNRYDRIEVYEAIRALPGRPLIAAHPTKASELPILTGKSQFVTKELSHPWWTHYWTFTVKRTHDFFRGYYTHDPRELRDVIERTGIDWWLVDRKDFDDAGRRDADRGYMPPFDEWIAETFPTHLRSRLATVPESRMHWSGERYFLVSSDELLAHLEDRGVLRGR